MAGWLIRIIVCSVAMSLILKVIPESSVKKTVHIAFGIVFLLVTAVPVLNAFSQGFDAGSIDFLFKDQIGTVAENSDDNYVKKVIEEYASSVEKVAEKNISEKNAVRCDVKVTVCSEVNSSLFGSVLNAKCVVLENEVTESPDGILSDKPLIDDIKISLGMNKKEPEFDCEGILQTLSDTLGITKDLCEIYVNGD